MAKLELVSTRGRRSTGDELIVSSQERSRLVEISENPRDRIAEAEREGRLGEIQGLSVSLDAAEAKTARIDARQERGASPVILGPPIFDGIAASTVTVRGDSADGGTAALHQDDVAPPCVVAAEAFAGTDHPDPGRRAAASVVSTFGTSAEMSMPTRSWPRPRPG